MQRWGWIVGLVWMVVLLGCGGEGLVKQTEIKAESGTAVEIVARSGGKHYVWEQLSGIAVKMQPKGHILRFVAPEVNATTPLRFRVTASFGVLLTPEAVVAVVVVPPKQEEEPAPVENTPQEEAKIPTNDRNRSVKRDVNTTMVKSVMLTIEKSTLNKDANTTVKVEAIYSDNTTKDVTNQAEWLITPKEAVKIEGNTLTALKDVNVTLQATYQNRLSNKINLNIYWEVNGHRLPPEPDPKVNNATLLGVDVNRNGVRDDVERWIYETYKEYVPCHQELDYNNTVVIDGKTIPSAIQVCEERPVPYHPVVRAVAMQGARAAQIIIQEPERARETLPVLDRALNCDAYITTWSRITENKVYTSENDIVFSDNFKKIQFNTVERARAYAKFNYYLSGGVYSADETSEELKAQCSDEVKKYLKDLK